MNPDRFFEGGYLDIIDIFGFLAASGAASDWKDTWPFGPGYAEGLASSLLKFGLIAVFFLGIAGLLRFLFGPGGFMRDKEFDLPPETADQAGEPDQAGDRSVGDGADGSKKTGGPHA